MQENRPIDESENIDEIKVTSYFFGPIAFWILVGALLVAIWFKFFPLIAIASFLIVLSLFIYLWKEYALRKLKFALVATRTRIFSGDPVQIDASLSNNKWLPLVWVEVAFPKNELITWGKNEKKAYLIRFLWLLSHQRVDWQIEGQARKRGIYKLNEVTLRSGDGFRFVEKERKYDIKETLYIYPALVPIQVPQFQPTMQWEVQGNAGGFIEDPLIISGIREYEPGDEWRRFNWHASARTGKMITNVYQPIISKQVVFYIDVEGFVINKNKFGQDLEKQQQYEAAESDAFEYFLSIITSLIVVYVQRGVRVGYFSNGVNDGAEKQPYIAPTTQMTNVLDQIAGITQNVVTDKISRLDQWLAQQQRKKIPLTIFCRQITKQHFLWYERNKQQLDVTIYFVNQSEYTKNMKTAKPIQQLLKQTAVVDG